MLCHCACKHVRLSCVLNKLLTYLLMLTRKLLSVIDNIVVDVFKTICCSQSTDSFMVNVTVAQLPGHKVLQPGPVPQLAPPWRRHWMAVVFYLHSADEYITPEFADKSTMCPQNVTLFIF